MEDTAQQLQELKKKLAQDCLNAIDEVLKAHSCILNSVPEYVSDGAGGWKLQIKILVVPS